MKVAGIVLALLVLVGLALVVRRRAGPLAPGSMAKLANDNFELYEMKTGEKAGELSGNQIKELQKGYVGRKVSLLVYESGEFTGIPKNLPPDVLVWADREFHFRSYLVVIGEKHEN